MADIVNNSKDIYEIVDTALKIGLGALIGGAFSFITLKSSQKPEISKENINQKTLMIKDVNNAFIDLVEGTYSYLDFHISMTMIEIKSINNLQDIDLTNYKEIEENYLNTNKKIGFIKSNLSLLEMKQAQLILRNHDQIMSNYRSNLIQDNNKLISHDVIKLILNKILVLEEEYLRVISNYYKRIVK